MFAAGRRRDGNFWEPSSSLASSTRFSGFPQCIPNIHTVAGLLWNASHRLHTNLLRYGLTLDWSLTQDWNSAQADSPLTADGSDFIPTISASDLAPSMDPASEPESEGEHQRRTAAAARYEARKLKDMKYTDECKRDYFLMLEEMQTKGSSLKFREVSKAWKSKIQPRHGVKFPRSLVRMWAFDKIQESLLTGYRGPIGPRYARDNSPPPKAPKATAGWKGPTPDKYKRLFETMGVTHSALMETNGGKRYLCPVDNLDEMLAKIGKPAVTDEISDSRVLSVQPADCIPAALSQANKASRS